MPERSSSVHSPATTSRPPEETAPRITLRALILGTLTIAAMFYYIIQVAERLGLGSYVHSQYPMAAFIPFVLWLFVNVALKHLWPNLALRRGELLTIFVMTWVVGTIPQLGWMDYWLAILALPSYNATPENQYAELLFDYLPWHVFPDTSPRVLNPFWLGLPEGMDIPWKGWVRPLLQWLGVSLALVIFGFCLIALFQRHWVEAEKLTFPLAQMPLDLTRGFDGPRCLPDLFRTPLFWMGFAAVFVPMLYNIGTYFNPGLPAIELYLKYHYIEFGPGAGLLFRVVPLVLALTYLCPVDILGSLWVFHLLAVLKVSLMERVGFSVGGAGQAVSGGFIIYMESYGATIFLALWSFWLGRQHLRRVWHQVRTGAGDPREVAHYRLVLAGLVLSAIYVVYWLVGLGMSLTLALGSFVLMTLVYFVIAKLVAATGFTYLLPRGVDMKGQTFITVLIGSAYLPARDMVAYKLFTSKAFFGYQQVPAWPALTHLLRIFSLRQQPRWVSAVVFVAFPVGFLVAAWAAIDLAYDEGGAVFLSHKGDRAYNDMVHNMHNPRFPDLGYWGIWFSGFFEAAAIAFMRGRFHWFPLHPIGPAFQNTHGIQFYWFSLFLVWLVKVTLLHYGGVKAFRAGKPFFYGLGIGYVIGVTLSGAVDLIWFPVDSHPVHGW